MGSKTERDRRTDKLTELIQGIRVAMLTTTTADGTLRSRPMIAVDCDCADELWFFIRGGSSATEEIQADAHVNLSFADPDRQRYVSVSGQATVVRDAAKAKESWDPLYQKWFPRGLNDPDLAMLKVRVGQAEYWDEPSTEMVPFLDIAQAIDSQKYASGAHAEVPLKDDQR